MEVVVVKDAPGLVRVRLDLAQEQVACILGDARMAAVALFQQRGSGGSGRG
jgi:hypothetical protein